jgi:hypothetical protein
MTFIARARRLAPSPLSTPAWQAALLASLVLAIAALGAGTVRLLPWLFDPAVPWRVAAPFARGLASVAIESALLVGWPVGWALASARLAESGEARVLQALGERPMKTVSRLLPQALLFAGAIGSMSLVWGRDANEPGRVATELIAQARASCAAVRAPKTYAVPFTDLTWLCAPATPPRLVGSAPGALVGTTFTATGASIAADFRAIALTEARLVLPTNPAARVHVGSLTLRGLAPWTHASTLSPMVRAILFALSGASIAWLAALAALRGAVQSRVGAIAVGAAGPLAALGLLRILERADARPLFFAAMPLAGALGVGVACLAAIIVSRLPAFRAAASSIAKPWGTSASRKS